MSTSIPIKADHVAQMMEKEYEKGKEILVRGCHAAALRLVSHLIQLTDDLGITYLGVYKARFQAVEDTTGQWSVENDAPHAGIVELGARPHKVSLEGQEAIRIWCMRKLGLDEKEAASAAFAICKKIELVGQEGRYVMQQSLPKAREFLKEELARVLTQYGGKPA